MDQNPEQNRTTQVMGALQGLYRVVASTEHAALLDTALRSGLLARCREPVSVPDLAAALGKDPAVVGPVCTALDAYGALVRNGDRYRLTEDYQLLLADDVAAMTSAAIGYGLARARLIGSLLVDGGDYWTADPATQLAIAAGVSFPPDSSLAQSILRDTWEVAPDARDRLAGGGRYLELGCGVAGGLLTSLLLFPDATAVGVELSPALVAEARARAEQLGVADRARFVQADAGAFDEDGFDVLFWSQFFFSEPSRPAALTTAFRALRPGGYLVAPLLPEPSVLEDDLHSDDGRELAIDFLVHGSWGVPLRGADYVVAEVEAAGFVDVRVVARQVSRLVLARRP